MELIKPIVLALLLSGCSGEPPTIVREETVVLEVYQITEHRSVGGGTGTHGVHFKKEDGNASSIKRIYIDYDCQLNQEIIGHKINANKTLDSSGKIDYSISTETKQEIIFNYCW